MKIGIIGAGHIGSTLAKRFVEEGHEVAIANSRGPETLADLEHDLEPRGRAVTSEEAARFGDVVIVTVPFKAYRDIPTDGLDGKIVIDTNNYYPQRDGHFEMLDDGTTTSSEMLQAHIPRAHVVKAFNSLYAQWFASQGKPHGARDRIAVPIAGDDPRAKEVVAHLIDQIGFDAVDVGPLAAGRLHQPGTAVYTVRLTADELRQRLGLERETQPLA